MNIIDFLVNLVIAIVINLAFKNVVLRKILFVIIAIIIVYRFFSTPNKARNTIYDFLNTEITLDRLFHVLYGVSGAICGYLITFILGLSLILLVTSILSIDMMISQYDWDLTRIWQDFIPPLLRVSPLLIIFGSTLGIVARNIRNKYEWPVSRAYKLSFISSAITGIVLSA
jgi:hypothetical protein